MTALWREPSVQSTHDRLLDENAALVSRLASLRELLERVTAETASLNRRQARLRAENRALRAALERREQGQP
jgi:predicted nuclease with TOPRIM domain